jgi:hypothetical protein
MKAIDGIWFFLPYLVPAGALVVSAGALVVSFLSWRVACRAAKTGLLTSRLEAIRNVREAIDDVVLQDVVNAQTTASLREAFQLSRLVFNHSTAETLEKLHHIAFRLQKPSGRYTDQDEDDREFLKSELGKVFERMNSEAAITQVKAD